MQTLMDPVIRNLVIEKKSFFSSQIVIVNYPVAINGNCNVNFRWLIVRGYVRRTEIKIVH